MVKRMLGSGNGHWPGMAVPLVAEQCTWVVFKGVGIKMRSK